MKNFFKSILLMVGLLVFNVSEQLANKSGRKFATKNEIEEYQKLLDSAERRNFESFECSFESVTGRMPRAVQLELMKMLQKNLGSEAFESLSDSGFESLIAAMPRIPAKFTSRIAQAAHKDSSGMAGNPHPSSYTAQFDLRITRIQTSGTKAIPNNLPIHIFNPLNLNNQFASFLTGLPAGVSCVVQVNGNNLDFIYTKGSDVDTITISGITQDYITLMAGLMNAEFNCNKIRLSSTTANYASWFSQLMSTARKTIFGKITDLDAIPFIAVKSPMQQDPTILDLDVNLHFQNDKGLTYTVPQVFIEPLTMSVFVSDFIVK